MLKRIALILQTQNLTVSQFADRIGVQRSALSHVLGGRNNPSLDFVTKILRTFPEIRSQWLLFGEGKMYDAVSGGRPAEEPVVDRPVMEVAMPAADVLEAPVAEAGMPSAVASERPLPAVEMPTEMTSEIPLTAVSGLADGADETVPGVDMPLPEMAGFEAVQPQDSHLVKVVFFYSDGRFEEYARR